MFEKYKKQKVWLKMGLIGESDTGKTYTALTFARLLIPKGKGKRVAVVDADDRRTDLYFETFGLEKWADVMYLDGDERLDPLQYIRAIEEAEEKGYEVMVIDSLSFFWLGILDLVEDQAKAMADKKGDGKPEKYSFNAWGGSFGGNRYFHRVMSAIAKAKMHIICTVKAKPGLEIVEGEGGGIIAINKSDTPTPIFRKGQYMYEFTIFGRLERSGDGRRRILSWDKTAECKELEGGSFDNPGKDVIDIIRETYDV